MIFPSRAVIIWQNTNGLVTTAAQRLGAAHRAVGRAGRSLGFDLLASLSNGKRLTAGNANGIPLDLAGSLDEHPPRHWFANIEQLACGATVALRQTGDGSGMVHGDLRRGLRQAVVQVGQFLSVCSSLAISAAWPAEAPATIWSPSPPATGGTRTSSCASR